MRIRVKKLAHVTFSHGKANNASFADKDIPCFARAICVFDARLTSSGLLIPEILSEKKGKILRYHVIMSILFPRILHEA